MVRDAPTAPAACSRAHQMEHDAGPRQALLQPGADDGAHVRDLHLGGIAAHRHVDVDAADAAGAAARRRR